MKEKFDNEYLDNKLEPKQNTLLGNRTQVEFQIAEYTEFGEHSYVAEKGKFEFEMGDTKISMEYSQPDFEEIAGPEDSLFGLDDSVTIDDLKNKEELKPWYMMFKEIRVIEKLVLDNGQESYDTSVNFANQNKTGRIYFNFNKNLGAYSNIDRKDLKMCISEDPLTPTGLMNLFHEIGHYEDRQAYTEEEYEIREEKNQQLFDFMENPLNPMDAESAQVILEDERRAWSIALKNIRPFAKDLQFKTEKMDNFIHGNCLQSYSDTIRLALENQDLLTLFSSMNIEKETI